MLPVGSCIAQQKDACKLLIIVSCEPALFFCVHMCACVVCVGTSLSVCTPDRRGNSPIALDTPESK